MQKYKYNYYYFFFITLCYCQNLTLNAHIDKHIINSFTEALHVPLCAVATTILESIIDKKKIK